MNLQVADQMERTAAAESAVDVGAVAPGNLRRAAARGGVSIIAGRLAVQFLTLGVTFLVARLLRPYDYGIVTTSGLFLNFADTLATAGLGVALVQRQNLTEEDTKEVFTVTLILSVFLVIALFLGAEPLSRFFQTPELTLVLRVSSLLLLLIPFRTVAQSLLERRLQLGRSAIITTSFSILQSVVVLSAALAGLGYWSLVLGFGVSRILEAAALLQQARWRPGLRRPRAQSRDLVSFGARYTGSGLLWQIYGQADFAIAGRLFGPHVLGIYSLAFQSISIPANRISASLGQVSYTIFCRMQDQPERMRDWCLRLFRLLAAFGLPVFAGLALVAADAVAVVLGPRWMPAVVPIQMLCLPGYILYINATFYSIVTARGRPDLPMRFNGLFAMLLPPLFLVFGLVWGLRGICLTWMVIYPVTAGIFVSLSRSVVGFGLRELLLCHVPTLKASCVMTVAVLLVQHSGVALEGGMARLITAVVTGAFVYLGAIWTLERETVFRDLRILLRDLKG